MPFRKRLERWKDEFKLGLGFNSDSAGIASDSGSNRPATDPDSTHRSLVSTNAMSSGNPKTGANGLAMNSPLSLVSSIPAQSLPDPITPPRPGQTSPIQSACSPNPQGANQTAWSGIKSLLDILDTSAGIFPPLQSAIRGLNECIDLFEGVSRGRQEYENTRAKLDSLLRDLYQFLSSPTNRVMTTSMKNFCIEIQEEVQLIQQKHTKNGTHRIAEILTDSEELLDCYRRIQERFERLMLNANLNMWQIIDRQETEMRLRQLLPIMSAIYNSAESQDVQRRSCTPGTRERELDKLLEWAHNKKSKSVYWMNGMAGTGKTTIAYTLCDALEKKAELGASFFCSRLIPECRNVKLIIPAIAYQLARFSHPFRYALSQVLEADPDVHTRILEAQFNALIIKPLEEVQHTLPADFVVVIDALDECENESSVGQMLDILLSYTSTSDLPVRFLLSSRPEAEIYFKFMSRAKDNSVERLVLHDLDAGIVKHDIETYLQAELKEVYLTPSRFSALVEHSGVLFLYASTSARYIKDGFRLMEHEERLDMILGLTPPSANNKDRVIDELYASILKSAFEKKHLDESSRTRMKVLLDAIICLQEPVTVSGLATLLKFKSGVQVDALLRPLCSVINIADPSGVVTTLHASFPDFMLNPYRSCAFCCDSQTNHKRLAQACFRRIEEHRSQFNICGFQSSYSRDDAVAELDKSVERAVPADLFYACNYWINHLELSEPSANMVSAMSQLLSTRLLLWIEVLNVKRSIHVGVGILRRAEKWSMAHNCPEEIVALASDAWRFVAMFASHAVAQSTPHLYLSMLPFWPKSSPVSQSYMRHTEGTMATQGALTMKRQLALLATWAFQTTITSACFSPDGSRIACGPGFAVYLIDSTTGKTLIGPMKHDDLVNSVAFSPDGAHIASGSDDKTVRIWNSENGQMVSGPFAEHGEAVKAVGFSPDGVHIASGSDDMTIRIWNIQSRQTVVGPLTGHTGSVRSLCFSPDGVKVASGSADKTIRIWDSKSGELALGPLEGHTGTIDSVSFSPDGTRLASGSSDQNIRVWSTRDGQKIFDPLNGHSDGVAGVTFSFDGRRILSSSYDSTIRLWDIDSTPISSVILEGHTNGVGSATFSPDGTRVVSASLDNTVRLWDPPNHSKTSDPPATNETVLSVAFSHDGKYFATGSTDYKVRIWDTEEGQMTLGPLVGHTSWVQSVCFSPDDSRIVSGSDDKHLRLWNTTSGETPFGPLKGHANYVNTVSYSPDGVLIASGSSDNTIRLWDAANGDPVLSPFEGHTDDVDTICFSPDGKKIVSGSADKTVRVWDISSGQTLVGPLDGHTGEISAVHFSPDGTRFVSASLDGTIRGWDASNGNLVLGPIDGHTSDVQDVAFSPNGALLVSASDDRTIRFWNTQNGEAVGSPIRGHAGWILCLAISPQGTRLVTTSEDKSVRMWNISDILGAHGDHSHDSQTPRNHSPERPSQSYQDWVLQDDGWVVDSESRLLAWVPPDLHVALIHPRNTFMILNKGSFALDFDSAKLGDSWVGCYTPISPVPTD